MAGVLLALTIVSAALDWVSRLRHLTRLEIVTKPLTTVLVIALAVVGDAPTDQRVVGVIALVLCLVVAIGVSLFTKPKPDAELTNLVMGLTPIPREENVPLIERPLLWASLVGAALIAINIIFW